MREENNVNSQVIRLLRKTRRWTQEELAAASGVSLRTIQRVEREGSASTTTLKSLAAAFAVSVEDLEPKRFSFRLRRNWGPLLGLCCGYGGALLGGFMSIRGQLRSLHAGETTAAELGVSAGLTGALVGLSCALIGVFYNWQKRQVAGRRDAT